MSKYNREYRKRKLQEDENFFKKYNGRSKEKQSQYNKEYRQKKIKSDPDFFNRYREDNKEKINEKNRKYYKNNAEKIAGKKHKRRQLLNDVKLAYGCCNPECCWAGHIDSCALDFHHLDPSSKETCVTFLSTSKMLRIVEEVRKCTVLCAVCHRLERFGIIDANDFTRCEVDENCLAILY